MPIPFSRMTRIPNPATTASPEVATIEAVLREFTEVNRMIYIQHAREGLDYTQIA